MEQQMQQLSLAWLIDAIAPRKPKEEADND